MQSEEWRDVRGWEGFYQVSDLGRVRSVERVCRRRNKWGNTYPCRQKSRILRPGTHEHGYKIVALADSTNGRPPRTFRVHRLVCEAFHGPQPEGHEVAHNDNTRDNNAAENLRWATHYDNIQDAVRARRGEGVYYW